MTERERVIYMVVDLKVLIGIVDDDDPGTCQNFIWRKFFSSWRKYVCLAKDMAKDVLSAVAATTAAAAATNPAAATTTSYYYYSYYYYYHHHHHHGDDDDDFLITTCYLLLPTSYYLLTHSLIHSLTH